MNASPSYLITTAPAPWKWVLGDGLVGGANCLAPCPPRRAFYGDPAASLVLGELMPAGVVKAAHFRRDSRLEAYQHLDEIVGTEGIFYHTPSSKYSADRFVTEFVAGRVRLSVPRSAAEEYARLLPLPVFFTHRRVPLFRDADERDTALAFVAELLFAIGSQEATWTRPQWGLGPADEDGGDHYMVGVLRLVDRLDWDWPMVADREPWQRARRFFRAVNFAEQVFGASWISMVVEESA